MWYTTLSLHFTDQVWLLSWLTYFYLSYYPLKNAHPLSFPNFSQSSFGIFTWNLVYDFVMARYRSSSTFVSVDLLSLELLPFANMSVHSVFLTFFSVILWDIDLKLGIRLCLDMIQIKFDFCVGWPIFTWVIALCKHVRPLGFPNFSQSSFEILTWNLVYDFVSFCKN